jgi:hypothetical protein
MTRFHIRLDLRLRFPADSDGPLLRLLRGFPALISAIALGAQGGLDRLYGAGFFYMAQANGDGDFRLAHHDRGPRHFAQPLLFNRGCLEPSALSGLAHG